MKSIKTVQNARSAEFFWLLLLKKHNIPHLFMGWQPNFAELVSEKNYMAVDWGYWSQNYPDDKGTGHCDYQGHQYVYLEIIKKVKAQI